MEELGRKKDNFSSLGTKNDDSFRRQNDKNNSNLVSFFSDTRLPLPY